MMNKTSARSPFAVSVVAVVFSLVLAACGAGQTPATATITSPASNAQFQGGDEVKIEGKVTGSAVKKVDIYVNNAKFGTIDKAAQPNEFAVSVVWTAPADIVGSSVIQLKGVDDKDQPVISSDTVFITIQAPPTPTPAPTAVPTSVPTAAPPEPTAAPVAPASAITPTVSPVLAAPRPENDLLNVRAQPDINAQRLGQLNKGQSAPVLSKNADGTWLQITFPGAPGNVGWVFAAVTTVTGNAASLPVVQPGATTSTTVTSTVAVATTAPATTATVAAPAGLTAPFIKLKAGQDFANLRAGPDVAYARVGQIDTTNSAAAVKGKNAAGSWYQIAFPAAPGGLAWVYGLLVDFTGDVSKVAVATAPPLPTAAAPAATAVPAASAATAVPAAPAPTAVPAQPASALLPYSQNVRFAPRDDIGDVPLGYQGEAKSSKLQYQINGATKAELEITAFAGTGIFSACGAGNLGSVSPNDAAGKRIPLALPSGEYNFSISGAGYYLFKIYVVKADGSLTDIPRNVIVDCFKSQ